MNSFIKKAFPVPKILTLSNVSIDATDGELRFFEFGRKAGSLRPKACGVLPFPRVHGSKNEGVAIEAAAALKDFAASRHYRAVRCLIHEGDAYIFRLKVPTVNPHEIRAAIESMLEENVPISPSETIFEYETISIDYVRGETLVAVSAVSEKVVSEYQRLLESGSLAPVSFDTESHAISRAIIKHGDHGAHAVLCIKARHTVVFVIENGKVTFSSSVEVGSTDLDAARAKAPVAKGDGTEDAQIFDTLLPVFSTLQDELGKVLIYFKTAAKKEAAPMEIQDVILMGSACRIAGFARYISITSQLPVRIGSVWTNLLSPEREVPELDERTSLDYASVIGTHIKDFAQ